MRSWINRSSPVPMRAVCSTSRATVRSAACVLPSITPWAWMLSRRLWPIWPSSRRSMADMSEQELQALRLRIDNLDERILELISDRARCAEEVARVKMKALPEGESPVFYRPEREAQVLKRIMERNQGPLANRKW